MPGNFFPFRISRKFPFSFPGIKDGIIYLRVFPFFLPKPKQGAFWAPCFVHPIVYF